MHIGSYCNKLGITEEVINGQKPLTMESKTIANGVMLELLAYKNKKKITLKQMIQWIINIYNLKCENSEALQEQISVKLQDLEALRQVLTKSPSRYRGELDKFMKWPFDFPAEVGMDPSSPFEPTASASLGPKLLKVLKEKGGDEEDAADALSDEDEETVRRKARDEIVQLKKDLFNSKKAISAINGSVSKYYGECEKLHKDLSQLSVTRVRELENHLKKSEQWKNILIQWHEHLELLNHVNGNKSDYMAGRYMVRRMKTKQGGIFDELNYELEKTVEEARHKISALLEEERKKKKVVTKTNRSKVKVDRKRTRQESTFEGRSSKRTKKDKDIESTTNQMNNTASNDNVKNDENKMNVDIDGKENADVKDNSTVNKDVTNENSFETKDIPEVKENIPEGKENIPEAKVDTSETKGDIPEVKENIPEVKTDIPDTTDIEMKDTEIKDVKETSCSEDKDVSMEQINIPMSLDEFMNSEKVDQFKGGKFVNALKVTYIELTSMLIPCNDVHNIIFDVLDSLEAINTDKLPMWAISASVLMEASVFARIKACQDFLERVKISISNDGETIFILENLRYNVTLPDKTVLKLDVKDILNGNPDTSMNLFVDNIASVADMKKELQTACTEFYQLVKQVQIHESFIRNNMNSILETIFYYKQNIDHHIEKSVSTCEPDDLFRPKLLHIENVATGIYFVLGLAQLTDVALFVLEDIGMGKCEENNQSNVEFLSKTVQDIQKFIDNVEEDRVNRDNGFYQFLKEKKHLMSVPYVHLEDTNKCLINTVFHNSAAVWFYHQTNTLNEFSKESAEIDNAKYKNEAIVGFSENSTTFARVLGLLGKLLATPLWTILENKDDVSSLGNRYKTALEKIQEWSKDASMFMTGQDRLFEDIPTSYDAVYISLIKENENDVLTRQFLEIIFSAVVPYLKHFLTVEGNVLNSNDCEKQLHDDFSKFDRISSTIHQFHNFAIDAIITYNKNEKCQTKYELSSEGKNKIVENLENISNKKLLYLYDRKNKIAELSPEKGQDMNKFNITRKYGIIDSVIKYGGLWKSEQEVESNIKGMDENQRFEALRAQIRYRRFILHEEHSGDLLDLASSGKYFSTNKLYENLKCILNENYKSEQLDFELATAAEINSVYCQKIIEECKQAAEYTWINKSSEVDISKDNFEWIIGKIIKHSILNNEGEKIMEGIVIGRQNLNGLFFYYVRYFGSNTIIVPESEIAKDYKKKKFQIVPPTSAHLLKSRISRAFTKNDGELEWHDCKVLGVRSEADNKYLIEYIAYESFEYSSKDENIPVLRQLVFQININKEYEEGRIRIL